MRTCIPTAIEDYPARRDILRVAAELLTAPWASPYAEDWAQRPTAAKVARELSKDEERRRLLSIRLKDALDKL